MRGGITPDAVAKKPKIHGVTTSGEAPNTRGRGGHRQGTRGIPMKRKESLAMTYMGIQEWLYYGTLVGCVSLAFMLLTHMRNHMMGDTHKKLYISTSGAKRENILRFALSDDTTSLRLCSQWTGWQDRRKSQPLSNWLLPCLPNGTGSTRQHTGM